MRAGPHCVLDAFREDIRCRMLDAVYGNLGRRKGADTALRQHVIPSRARDLLFESCRFAQEIKVVIA